MNFKIQLLVFFLFSGIILTNFGMMFAQNAQTTQNKADQNLKGSVRINPSTLAMEFSLPMVTYPGRNGNSLPVSINYSSKVWNMKRVNSRFERNQVSGQQEYDYLVYQSSDIIAQFSEKSIAGWNSSLQPVSIIQDTELYNQWGNLYEHDFGSGIAEMCNSSLTPPEYVCTLFTNWEGDISTSECGSGRAMFFLFVCVNTQTEQPEILYLDYQCQGGGGDPEPTPTPIETPTPTPTVSPLPTPFPSPTPLPQEPYQVNRLRLQMSDGSSHEFRKDDRIINCLTDPQECQNINGSYLSVNGSRMRFERGESQPGTNEIRDVLYLPDGGKYIFPNTPNNNRFGIAEKYIDAEGNVSTYNSSTRTWTDSLGREIKDPLANPLNFERPTVGNQLVNLKGLNNQDLQYTFQWQRLHDVFEDPSNTDIKYLGEDKCTSVLPDPVTTAPPTPNPAPSENEHILFANQSSDPLDDQIENRVRYIRKQRMCSGSFSNQPPIKFDPIVLSSATLPNGKQYIFKYNEYGEITKISYPMGGYERFEYGYVEPIGVTAYEIYKQANRGVKKRFVSYDGINETQIWNYSSNGNTIATIAPDGSRVEQVLYTSDYSSFGFEDSRSGMVKEEKVFDTNGHLKVRTLKGWDVSPSQGTGVYQFANRDPRLTHTISINYEGDKILASMSETDYETPGQNNSDLSYFAKLNPIQSKSYHYLPLTASEAEEAYDDAIVNLKNKFHNTGQLSSLTQTEYLYDSNYKARGISSLPKETKVLNPQNNETLARTRMTYDNQVPLINSNYPNSYSVETYGIGAFFECPSGSQTVICWQSPSSTYLGRPTTVSLWDDDNNVWHETHTQYDIFGNVIKVKDPTNNEILTFFENTYLYAYPTKVITPAHDSTNTHGTNETSSSETTYDFMTGLPLTVTNDFGQTTLTEYDDPLLRPTRVSGIDGFVIPTIEAVYDDNALTVKVRKQIDATNWGEATTFMDSLGRTIKTQSKDSQGDVFIETEYDNMGRVRRSSSPYREGDTKYWNRVHYDDTGRVVETCAPMTLTEINTSPSGPCPDGKSLENAAFSFSTVTNFVGTVVTSTDASKRKSRSITNALGQLIRVDEATATGGTIDADLGTLANPNQPTFYTYNAHGKMVKVQQGIQNRYFKYDSLGRLIRVKQPEQEANDNLDLADFYNTSGKWSAAFNYDALGNLRRATDANGVNIINEYDQAKRPTKRCYTKPNISTTATNCNQLNQTTQLSENTPTITYLYDGFMEVSQPPTASPNYAKGKLTRVSSSVSETRYTQFDYLGRLLQVEQRTPIGSESTDNATPRVSTYQYNFAGVLAQETYPSGRVVKNEFESDGDLRKVFGQANQNAIERTYLNNLSYTASGGIERMKLGNGKWETAKFNNRLQVTELGLGNGANDASLWKVNYEYGELESDGTVNLDKNTGNIAKQTLSFSGLPQPIVQAYKYDSLYRITEAKETANSQQNWIQQFGYDRYGNRIGFNEQIGNLTNTQTPQIDPDTNRFITTNQNFVYDKNGNLITDGEGRTFIFNGENKQAEVKNPSGVTVGKYYYDGEGNRVKKVTDTEITIFIYSSGKLVAEYSTATPPQNPTTKYLTEDHLGTPRIITDGSGNVVSRRDFMPFGEELTTNVGERGTTGLKYGVTDGIRQKFTGYQKDTETSLDFAEARMYENRHGRFTAVDPLLASGKSANPQTFNRYVYVGNNPILRIDPNGEDWYVGYKYKTINGKVYLISIEPVWFDEYRPGYKWGSSGTVKDNGRTFSFDTSFVYKDNKGTYSVVDPYEHRSNNFSSLEEAQAAAAKWRKQAIVNFIAGALSGYSIIFEFSGAAKGMKAETNSQMFKIGQGAGTGAQVGTAILGVGLVSMLINRFGKGALSILKGVRLICCFTAGTPIHTDKGLVPIEQIKVGDKVLSYNEKTKRYEYKAVAQTFRAVKENIVKLKIAGEKKIFTTTTEHPFYVKFKRDYRARSNLAAESDEDGEWKTADELRVGDRVLRPDGKWTRVLNIKRESKPTQVYNFEVEGNHNYFVGEIGVLSHNCDIAKIVTPIASKFGLGQCKTCANAVIKVLKANGIKGELLEITSPGAIYSVKAGKEIATEGFHQGVRVGNMVYDNVHPNGILYEEWIKDFLFPIIQKDGTVIEKTLEVTNRTNF